MTTGFQPQNIPFGDYLVFVDESGDHSLESINQDFPIFVLAFCIVKKDDYRLQSVPALQQLKMTHFGHDQVILHEHDIRKRKGPFAMLMREDRRDAFMGDMNTLIDGMPFTIISCVIQKEAHKAKYIHPQHPYKLSMEFGLERVVRFLEGNGQAGKLTHTIVESRGKKEDDDLELEFRRICDGQNYRQRTFPLDVVFAHKQTNCSGLQLADLVARPIGRHIMAPDQPNRAWDLIEPKLFRSAQGKVDGYGLKRFP